MTTRTPPTPAPSPTPPAPPPRRRVGEVAAWISAITGLLGLVLGFFGLPAVFGSPTARTATPTVTSTVTVTATPDGTQASPSESAPAVGASDVVKSLTVDIAADYGIRLADDPMRPVAQQETELYWDAGNLRVDQGAQLVLLDRKESGTYETCGTVTRFRETVFINDLSKGDRFCLLSPKGLVALAEYVEGEAVAEYVRLKFTVWNGSY
ncbi:hypothetical protein H9Y04_21365 [Streptomyces sp. TRM66268-LWL]|uniref:Serine/threonine protein kinase n=1 Tax=Streptomyces polyasparticus TaxID=2767826 RepID=A0ABR7SJS9_9ACTN|nr:hypothetical protein [Streptomyces polyasparticus]MBC9715104.1 hypothetical protein [Streptomyces polyasparticus]